MEMFLGIVQLIGGLFLLYMVIGLIHKNWGEYDDHWIQEKIYTCLYVCGGYVALGNICEAVNRMTGLFP